MKTLALLFILLAGVLGMPLEPEEVQVPVLEANQRPLVGDLLPNQGHVVVENPAPHPEQDSKKELRQSAPLLEDENPAEQKAAPIKEVNVGPELSGQDIGVVQALVPNAEMMKIEKLQDNNTFLRQLDNVEDSEPIQEELKERHNDMEGNFEFEQPIMKLEPLTNEEMQSDELLDTGKTFVMNSDVYEEPIMFLEPETDEDPFINEQMMPSSVTMEDEGPMLDALGEPVRPIDEYFPNDKEFMKLELDPKSQMELSEEPLMLNSYSYTADENKKGRRFCAGVVLEGKCYQYFPNPKKAAHAEFFCQENFPGGHMASITSATIHAEMMFLMRQNGGTRRTWVGGLRFLDTGRFVWLDGSQWSYADWLSGEPNNTSDLEDCLEVLPSGKFNDFTCWEPQAFICSYPYQ